MKYFIAGILLFYTSKTAPGMFWVKRLLVLKPEKKVYRSICLHWVL